MKAPIDRFTVLEEKLTKISGNRDHRLSILPRMSLKFSLIMEENTGR